MTDLPLASYRHYENSGGAIQWLSEAFGIVGSTTARAGAHVFVEDADAHRASARQAGAEIMEPRRTKRLEIASTAPGIVKGTSGTSRSTFATSPLKGCHRFASMPAIDVEIVGPIAQVVRVGLAQRIAVDLVFAYLPMAWLGVQIGIRITQRNSSARKIRI